MTGNAILSHMYVCKCILFWSN